MYWEVGILSSIDKSIRRQLVYSKEEVLDLVNQWNGKKNLMRSVYHFTRKNNFLGDYSSAFIDKIPFDFDTEEAFEITKNLDGYLIEKDIRHYSRFSGNGYHLFVESEVLFDEKYDKKSILASNQLRILEDAGIEQKVLDKALLGDMSRLIRIPNTVNMKLKASKRYCINLDKLDSDEEIKIRARRKSTGKVVFGNKYYSLDKEGTLTRKVNKELEQEWMYIKGGIKGIKAELPPCLVMILNNHWAGYPERFPLITYLKEMGYSLVDAHSILKEHLTKKRNHGFREETDYEHGKKEIDDIYKKYDYIFPNCEEIKSKGLCPIEGKCGIIKKLYCR